MALAWSLDKIGPICRGVEDCALVFSAIHGPDERDLTVADVPFQWDPRAPLARIRIGIDTGAFEAVAEEGEKPNYDAVLETLRELGVDPRPVSLPAWRPEYESLMTGLSVEAGASFQALTLNGGVDGLVGQGEHSWPNNFRVASTVPAVEYLQSMRVRRQLQERMAEALQDVDVYVTVAFKGRSLLYTNMTGHPSVLTRCGMVEGKPRSVEFIGSLYREPEALRVALACEQAAGWNRDWPELTVRPIRGRFPASAPPRG
jgi:Asp-tRNA(Asn)/Glu-tRNA(Gln) amidotransferase A subunit family amidase